MLGIRVGTRLVVIRDGRFVKSAKKGKLAAATKARFRPKAG